MSTFDVIASQVVVSNANAKAQGVAPNQVEYTLIPSTVKFCVAEYCLKYTPAITAVPTPLVVCSGVPAANSVAGTPVDFTHILAAPVAVTSYLTITK